MTNKLTTIALMLMSSSLYAAGEAEKLKTEFTTAFYWIGVIGFIIALAIIAISKVWPDTFLEEMAKRYKKQLAVAVGLYIAFGVFKGPLADFVAWLTNPTDGIL